MMYSLKVAALVCIGICHGAQESIYHRCVYPVVSDQYPDAQWDHLQVEGNELTLSREVYDKKLVCDLSRGGAVYRKRNHMGTYEEGSVQLFEQGTGERVVIKLFQPDEYHFESFVKNFEDKVKAGCRASVKVAPQRKNFASKKQTVDLEKYLQSDKRARDLSDSKKAPLFPCKKVVKFGNRRRFIKFDMYHNVETQARQCIIVESKDESFAKTKEMLKPQVEKEGERSLKFVTQENGEKTFEFVTAQKRDEFYNTWATFQQDLQTMNLFKMIMLRNRLCKERLQAHEEKFGLGNQL